jgi:hypothetical protein
VVAAALAVAPTASARDVIVPSFDGAPISASFFPAERLALTALYRDDLVKGGWAAALSGLGIPTATALGVISPAGVQTGTVDPHITSALAEGLATGHLSDEDRAWFESRGPGDALVSQIRVPTLLVQDTADTLFTPSEAIRNFELIKASGVPVHMLWFCGGHGVGLTQGDNSRVQTRVVGWLRRWLMGDHGADADPTFEWLADDGQWRSAGDLADGARARHDRPWLRQADLQPRGHAVLGPRRGRHAVPRRRERRHPVARRAGRRGRRAEARPRLPGHGDRPARLRLRADRRRAAPPRARQPGHADRDRARWPAALGLGARWRASPRPSSPPRTTRCRSRAARASTGRCVRRAPWR